MQDTLKAQLQKIPNKPGIYQYYDANSRLLYVGKAKNLSKRIKSYFTKECLPNPKNSLRIQYMVAQIASIHTLVVANEHEALILENSFIKSQNPKYNILLRDDKTYPYITINLQDSYPRFSITRKIIKHKDTLYFGPYPKGAKEILQSLYELFPLVQQAGCLKQKKPCIYYQIKKCLGVCAMNDLQTKKQYDDYIQKAISIMQNKGKMQKMLEKKMLDFASQELFEQAKICRDCTNILKEVEQFCVVDIKKLYNADVYSFVLGSKDGILFKLFVRDGKVVSTHHQFVRPNMLIQDSKKIEKDSKKLANNNEMSAKDRKREETKLLQKEDSKKEDLQQKKLQKGEFKKNNLQKEELKEDLQSEALQKDILREEIAYEIYTQALLKILREGSLCDDIILAGIGTKSLQNLKDSMPEIANKLFAPQKGEKLRLATLAQTNATHILANRTKLYAETQNTLNAIQLLFGLDSEITSIEVFDTSHHGGSFIVGGMISYSDYDFYKPGYRHYNLSVKDEYSQMREMLTRRIQDFEANPAPSLWLLDGGLAQINIALELLQSSGVYIPVLAIAKEKREFKSYRAKGHAKDILRSKDLEFRLNANDLRLQFLQKLRDEAHRFAITFHRSKKSNLN